MKSYLICVDSDGCAMDTMTVKHVKCFGPCMVEEWNLQKWAEPILNRWNEMNLYSMTRGINRFKGLAAALTEIDRQYTSVAGGMGSLRLDGICGLSNGTGCWNKNCLPAKNAGKGISARTCANDWRRP